MATSKLAPAPGAVPTSSRCLSLAFWWAWVWLMFFPGDPFVVPCGAAVSWWTIFLASASLMAGVLLCSKGAMGLFTRPFVQIACCILIAAFTFAAPLFFSNVWVLGCAVCVVGAASTIWGSWSVNVLRDLPPKALVSNIASAMFLGAVLFLLMSDHPGIVCAFLASLLPLLSIASVIRGCDAPNELGELPSSPVRAVFRSRVSRDVAAGSGMLCAALVLCAMTFGIFGGIISQAESDQVGFVVILGICIVTFAIVVLRYVRPKAVNPSVVYSYTIPFYVVGLVFLLASMTASHAFEDGAAFFVVIGWTCSIALGWGAFLLFAPSEKTGFTRPVLCILFVQFGTLCGSVLLAVAEMCGLHGDQLMFLPMVLIVALVLLLSAAAVRSHDVSALPEPSKAEDHAKRSDDASCEDAPPTVEGTIIATFGLSDREADVFCALLKGHSLPRIAEEVGLAKSTVATHCQHIYKKLDVHSRQEFLKFVETYGAGER